MATDSLPDLVVARHGKCRMYVVIDEQPYVLKRLGRDQYKLSAQGGARDGANYRTGRTRTSWHCSCPDHQNRGVRCKHIGALIALGLLSRPRKAVV